MELKPLIEASRLSKCYHLWNRPADRLLAASMETLAGLFICPGPLGRGLTARAKKLSRPFFALQEVSFSLEAGESLGIIGRNGSGKSTLLQILAGTLTPTSGTFAVRGRVAALLELGSGFNPEFTGRENVLLQAALAGFSRTAAVEHFEEVAEFAAIGEFIDQPVKTYSSGMMVRLAFATQTILRPDIFIVDEALAVGDIFFQAKCARFFQQRLAEGMSLLFVSHDLTSVKTLCRRALVLDGGSPVFFGPSADAVNHFHHLHSKRDGVSAATSVGSNKERPSAEPVLPLGTKLRNWHSTSEIGTREAEIVHCRTGGEDGVGSHSFFVGEPFWVEVIVQGNRDVAQVQFALEISDRHNHVVYGVSSVHLGLDYQAIAAGETLSFKAWLGPLLGAGDYLVAVALGCGDRGDGAPSQHVHRVAGIATVSFRHRGLRPNFLGTANLQARMEVQSRRAEPRS